MLLTVTANSQAADFDPATYHDGNCMRCHGTEVYTRSDRRVTSYPALQTQVARCDSMLETKLFPEDLQQLVDLLNDRYYQFEN
jgi:hypothetical protein